MTAEIIAQSAYSQAPCLEEVDAAMRPSLEVIDGEVGTELGEQSVDSSAQLHEWYFKARAEAAEVPKPEGEELETIQDQVSAWLTTQGPLKDGLIATYEQYAGQDAEAAEQKLTALTDFLRAHGRISNVELDATDLFLRSTKAMYESIPEDGSVHPDADGSFAFVVPARMSRKNTEYGQEVEKVIPALRYVPNELRAPMMVGLRPFVIDRYNPTEDGKRGYLVFAPVFPDMVKDLSTGEAARVGRAQVNDAVDFAYGRLGTEVIGLGAILPSITRYGATIENENVITTTGHGGTVHLIFKTLERARAEGRVSDEMARKIGVLGLGAIGASIARIARDEYPEAEMTVYDVRQKITDGIAEEINAKPAKDEAQVLRESGIIISALPDIRMRLGELGLTPEEMKGKLIIDDSQPAAFDPEDVKRYGATLAWVVGEDGEHIVRGDYTYGDTLVGLRSIFGCEAEAATLADLKARMLAEGKTAKEVDAAVRTTAIRSAVTPAMVRAIAL
jgi:hypothetical protein